MNGPGWNPAVDPMLRMRPFFRAIIAGSSARVRATSETMFTWIISSSRSASSSANAPLVPNPALFTRNPTSTPRRRRSSSTRRGPPPDPRSAATTCARTRCLPSSSLASASSRSRLRATRTTSWPSAANNFAYSSPRPADAPVISAAFPLDMATPLARPDVGERLRDGDHLALGHFAEPFGELRAGEDHRCVQHAVRLHPRVQLVRAGTELTAGARNQPVDQADEQRMPAAKRRHDAPIAHHGGNARERLPQLLEGALRFAHGGGKRARSGLCVQLVVVEPSDVAQPREEREEQALRGGVAFHRAPQIVGQTLDERGPDGRPRLGLAGGGEQPALEAERQRRLLVERAQRGPHGPAADQRCLALHSFGQLLGQDGLPAERSLAQEQIVALEKADASGTLGGPERNAPGEPPQHATEQRRIGLMDGEELGQKTSLPHSQCASCRNVAHPSSARQLVDLWTPLGATVHSPHLWPNPATSLSASIWGPATAASPSSKTPKPP